MPKIQHHLREREDKLKRPRELHLLGERTVQPSKNQRDARRLVTESTDPADLLRRGLRNDYQRAGRPLDWYPREQEARELLGLAERRTARPPEVAPEPTRAPAPDPSSRGGFQPLWDGRSSGRMKPKFRKDAA